jgi:hypothetical protein
LLSEVDFYQLVALAVHCWVAFTRMEWSDIGSELNSRQQQKERKVKGRGKSSENYTFNTIFALFGALFIIIRQSSHQFSSILWWIASFMMDDSY